jgi:hypothetical protein
MCLSKDTYFGEGYFFFFLPVFFFAFFAFLAMLPSAIPKLVICKSTSTSINTEYTTIAKLIRRASKKVNGAHTMGRDVPGSCSFSVDGRQSQFRQCIVGLLFFRQRLVQQLDSVLVSELVRPSL